MKSSRIVLIVSGGKGKRVLRRMRSGGSDDGTVDGR